MPQFRVNFVEATHSHTRERPLSSLTAHREEPASESREQGGARVREEEMAVAQLAYLSQLRKAKENGKLPVCLIADKSSAPIFTFASSNETFQDVSEGSVGLFEKEFLYLLQSFLSMAKSCKVGSSFLIDSIDSSKPLSFVIGGSFREMKKMYFVDCFFLTFITENIRTYDPQVLLSNSDIVKDTNESRQILTVCGFSPDNF